VRKNVNGEKTPNLKNGNGGINIKAFSLAGMAGTKKSNRTCGIGNSNMKSNIKMMPYA